VSSILQAPAVRAVPSGPLRGRLRAPASKSVTNRLLAIAALADGDSELVEPLRSDDATAMRRLVSALGATVTDDGDSWVVRGAAGRPSAPGDPINCGLSGTTLRFGYALAALAAAPTQLTGEPGLLRRPVGPLTEALRGLGGRVTDEDGFPPVTAGGGLTGGAVSVDIRRSSQFASAVLLAAPYAAGPVDVAVTGAGARGYVELTVSLMREWGAIVNSGPESINITPGPYRARRCDVEYDASAAAHLFALAVATGGEVTVINATTTTQPDAAVTDVFAAMGAEIAPGPDGVTVKGPAVLRPVDVDLAAAPDQVTTVAALASLADGVSAITGVGVTRGHETDRLAALATELRRLGVSVTESDDGLTITGGTAKGPARLRTYDDHRLAMAFAAVAACVPDVVIEHPGCVTKTYPGFWDDAAAAGLVLEAVT
jgi:3-phosphoshikimate 1-carboxyvinyltransferase